ncbi:MAG: hypothetical protein ACI4M3_04655 [Acutalibacteraceae bacterium]
MVEVLKERLGERMENVFFAYETETLKTPLKNRRIVFGTPQVKTIPLIGQRVEQVTVAVTVWTTEKESQSCADFVEEVRHCLELCDSEGYILRIEQDKCSYDTAFLAMKCVLHLTLCGVLEGTA